MNNDANPVRATVWDVQADRVASYDMNRTRDRISFFVGAPIALPATAIVLTAGGLPTAGQMATGSVVNGAINAGAQKLSKPNENINWIDVGGSAVSGGFGYGKSLLQSALINSETTMYASAIQNQYAAASIQGAIAGTEAGSLVDKSFDFASKYLPVNNYTQPIKQSIPILKPVISGVAGEVFSNFVKDKTAQ